LEIEKRSSRDQGGRIVRLEREGISMLLDYYVIVYKVIFMAGLTTREVGSEVYATILGWV
jgi:hypothetical protein